MLPKVSIIIPTYNRSHLLKRALESALRQSYSNIEIIVVNDGSTDDTEEALKPYLSACGHAQAGMGDIIYIKQQNRGCAGAKNTGLLHSTGKFITNLDDDDLFLPQKVERQVELFMERPEVGICATGVYFIDANDQITGTYIPPLLSRENQVLRLLRRCFFVQSSVMIRREVHEKLGNYKEMLSEDYEFWLRASLHYEIGVVKELLTKYRRHSSKQLTGEENRPALFRDVKKHIINFIENTPIEKIIPSLQNKEEGDTILGLVLSEHKYFKEAERYFEKSKKDSSFFGLGMLHLLKRDWGVAEEYFKKVDASHPLAAKVGDALSFAHQIKELEKAGAKNSSPEAISVRKDFGKFYSSIIRMLSSYLP